MHVSLQSAGCNACAVTALRSRPATPCSARLYSVGTDAFVRDAVSSASARATRLIPILDRLLLADDAEGC